jgi:hypothetical protein
MLDSPVLRPDLTAREPATELPRKSTRLAKTETSVLASLAPSRGHPPPSVQQVHLYYFRVKFSFFWFESV